jgi:hypothetical protein
MYEPRFQRTDTLIAMIGHIQRARAIVLRAPMEQRGVGQGAYLHPASLR